MHLRVLDTDGEGMTAVYGAAIPQPPPEPGRVDVADVVIEDIQARVEAGLLKYGTKLQTFNGRDARWDLYQELIDAVMYLRQEMLERPFVPSAPDREMLRSLADELDGALRRGGVDATLYIRISDADACRMSQRLRDVANSG